MNNEFRPYLTVAEAADALAVSRKTIYRLVWRGELPSRRVGRGVRIPTAAITDGDGVRFITGGGGPRVVGSGRGSRSGIGAG